MQKDNELYADFYKSVIVRNIDKTRRNLRSLVKVVDIEQQEKYRKLEEMLLNIRNFIRR